jgi:hypothetical protein
MQLVDRVAVGKYLGRYSREERARPGVCERSQTWTRAPVRATLAIVMASSSARSFSGARRALASSTCGDARPARPAHGQPNVAIAEPEAKRKRNGGAGRRGAVLASSQSGCDNDVGEIDCTTIARYEIGPSCEGLAGSCNLLTKGYGFKRRIGAAIAKCWEGLGPGACNIKARERCNRQAVQSACPDQR